MRQSEPTRLICAAWLAALAIGCSAWAPPRTSHPDRDAQIMRVLDQYMDALNALDIEGHVATYHFPHFRYAGGALAVWATREEAMPLLLAPPEQQRARLREVLEPDWHRSEWTRREIVQGDATKVHVVTRFERLREDGSVIKAFDSLYIMTLRDGAWGIRGRSSFAP